MTADTVGGVWTYALELARALEPSNVQVVLASMGDRLSPQQHRALQSLENVTAYESSYKLEWMDEPWGDVEDAARWLLEIKRIEDPDLIHLNNYVHGALPWQKPVLVVGHSCVYSWFEFVEDRTPPLWWERYRREVSRGLQGADLVTAPTRSMLAALSRHYGPFRAADVVYNGRRPEDYLPASPEPFVLSAGRLWDEAKNTSILNEVAPSLEWPIYAVGSTEAPGGQEVRFESLRTPGSVPPEELAVLMSRASIYVLPAYYEPFGLTVLEAALAGCALVVGDIPSLREVWEDAAIYVPPDEPAAIRRQLERLTENDHLRQRRAYLARKRALRYTSRQMASGYLDIYRRLLEAQVSRTSNAPAARAT